MADADPVTVLLTGGMLAFLLLVHRFAPRLPGPLIAMLLAAAAVAMLGLEQYGVTVGAISGLPDPQLPDVTGSDLPICCFRRSVSRSSGTPTTS